MVRKTKFIFLIVLVAVLLTGCIGGRSLDMPSHLNGGAEPNPIRFINTGEVTRTFGFFGVSGEYAQQQELIKGVSGELLGEPARPNLECPYLLPRVRQAYLNAVAVLDRYVENSMETVDRVHVIYDYLVSRIKYDFLLFDHSVAGNFVDRQHNSFTIIGVFINGRAVCQGISRAFDLLVAIEGIESVEIEGQYQWDTAEDNWVTHTWNKVNIEGFWYNVDATAGSITAFINGREVVLFSHAYLLVSDSSMTGGRHRFPVGALNPPAWVDYPDLHDLFSEIIVDDINELFAVFDRAAASRGLTGRFELKLNFDHSSVDILAAFNRVRNREITEWYSKINGHYIFLLYS